jgi:homoserine kinase
MDKIKIQIPATSANMGPGFDSLGVAVSFYNTIEVQRSDKYSMNVYGEGSDNPKIQTNTMFLNIFETTYRSINDNKLDTFKFIFNNNIPISRGLGSSSIVILGAIYCAYLISDINISKRDLLNLALEYEKHADNITPAVYGGFCISSLHKNKVLSIHKSLPQSISALLIIPSKPMSTKMSRKILPTRYKKEDVVFNISHSSLMVAAFLSAKWDLLHLVSQDRIHERYRMSTYPELISIRKTVYRYRPLMCTLSGSGSTIFSMFYSDDINYVKEKIKENLPNDLKIISCSFDNVGIKQIQ